MITRAKSLHTAIGTKKVTKNPDCFSICSDTCLNRTKFEELSSCYAQKVAHRLWYRSAKNFIGLSKLNKQSNESQENDRDTFLSRPSHDRMLINTQFFVFFKGKISPQANKSNHKTVLDEHRDQFQFAKVS